MAMEQSNNGNNEFSGDNPFIVPPAGMFEPLSGDQFEITAPGDTPEDSPLLVGLRRFDAEVPQLEPQTERVFCLTGFKQLTNLDGEMGHGLADRYDLFLNGEAAPAENDARGGLAAEVASVLELESRTADGTYAIEIRPDWTDVQLTTPDGRVANTRYYSREFFAMPSGDEAISGPDTLLCKTPIEPVTPPDSSLSFAEIARQAADKAEFWRDQTEFVEVFLNGPEEPWFDTVHGPVALVGIDENFELNMILNDARPPVRTYDDVVTAILRPIPEGSDSGSVEDGAFARTVDDVQATRLYRHVVDAYRTSQVTPEHLSERTTSTMERRIDVEAGTYTRIMTDFLATDFGAPEQPVLGLHYTAQLQGEALTAAMARRGLHADTYIGAAAIYDDVRLMVTGGKLQMVYHTTCTGMHGDTLAEHVRKFAPPRGVIETLRNYLLVSDDPLERML